MSTTSTTSLLRAGLPVVLAAGLLAVTAQAVEPARPGACERPTGLRDRVSNTLMVEAAAEGEDTAEIDADPEMVPVAIDPDMPPQVLATLLAQAMRQGHLVVLLLPKP